MRGREETAGVLQESFAYGVKMNLQSKAKIMKICLTAKRICMITVTVIVGWDSAR
jgi:hypothetical protein